jgi:hypothetical protein
MPEIEIDSETELTENGEKKVVRMKLDAMTQFGNWAGTASQIRFALEEMADSKRQSKEELLEKGFEEDSPHIERTEAEAERFEMLAEELESAVDSELPDR